MLILVHLPLYHAFEAQQKESVSYGITKHNDANVVDEGSCAASTKSLIQHGDTRRSEEHPATAFAWKNFDGRWKLLTYLPVIKPEQSSHLGSQKHVDADELLPLPPPVVFIQFELQVDQMIRPTVTGSANSFGHCKDKNLRKSWQRNKRSRPLKDSSSDWLNNCFLPNKSPSFQCVDSSLTISKVFDGDIPKVEKSTKKNPRKKGKKKGKRFKRSLHKKELTETEMHSEKTLCDETHGYFDPSRSCEAISENKSSSTATSSDLPIQISKDKSDDEGCSGNHLNNSKTQIVNTSCNEKMEESDPTCFLSEDFSCETSNCRQSGSVGNSNNEMSPTSAKPIDASSHCYVDQDNAPLLESFMGGLSSYVNGCDGDFNNSKAQTILKENAKVNSLDSHTPFCPSYAGTTSCSSTLSSYDEEFEKSKDKSTCINRSKHQVGPDDFAGKVGHSIQTCSVTFQSGVPYKTGKDGRRRSGNSNNAYKHHNINTHGTAVKDGSHSVWLRVQKKDAEECVSRPKNLLPSPLSGVHDDLEISAKKNSLLTSRINRKQKVCKSPCLVETAAQPDTVILHSTVDHTNGILCKSHDEKSMHNAPGKLKVKPSSASKQVITHYSKKGSHGGKSNATGLLKHLDRHDELLGKSIIVGCHEPCASSESFKCTEPRKVEVSHISEVEQHLSEVETGKGTVSDGRSCRMHANSDHNIEKLSNPLEGTSKSGERVCHDLHSIRNDHNLFKENRAEGASAEHSKQDRNSGSLTQKWIPVGRKDVAVFNIAHVDDSLSQKEIVDVEIDRKDCFGSENLSDSTTNVIHNSSSRNICHEKKEHCSSGLETDLDKIVKVVNDAYVLQTISEGYHLLTGTPVAEFERVLQSASPVVCQVNNVSSCKSCFQNQLVGNSLCQHQIPDMPLGSLWHWYEKPGNYGLEVKVEDNLMKNLGNTRFEYRAYFVPYLSAIQIFGKAKFSRKNSFNHMESNASGVNSVSGKTFQPHTLPTFSMLLPKSPNKEATTSSPGRPPSLSRNDKCDHSVDGTMEHDKELLFEYFESEPPQQRKPLFEKIKELTWGYMSSTCNLFGNPSTLENIRIKDIHPASWFSVAWYPIYRIPDGSFRAAFLTYHSLGNFIQRMPESESSDAIHIISPVVGLQSYNSKGECWFQQSERKFKYAEKEQPFLNPTEILNERLRTLEQTASVMARASVHRGEQKSINRHFDYEFFLSRKW